MSDPVNTVKEQRSPSSRFVLRYGALDLAGPGHVAAIEDALRNAVVVEVCVHLQDAEPWFRLWPFWGVMHVVGATGLTLGTFASVEAALDHGWRTGGWRVGQDAEVVDA